MRSLSRTCRGPTPFSPLYSSDRAKAIGLAKRIRTGVVWVNNGINLADAPFGGFKPSGIGRESGRFGMEEYCEIQQVTWT